MARVQEIVSEMRTIYDLLLKDSTTYYIPFFQRDFVWNKDDANQLIEDIVNDTDNFTIETEELEGYLLGNIVLIDDQENNQKQVIDGQQRLTTLSIMAKALFDVINKRINETQGSEKTAWIQRLSDLPKAFSVMNDENEFKSLKILHDPGLGFGDYYRKLINDQATEEDIVKEADANIAEIYNTFYEYIDDIKDAQLKKFISYYKNKIKLIETTAPTEAKAFQLFEILNDRGRSLEPMDLIKNGFLQVLNVEGKQDNKIEDFNNDWRETMENLQPSPKKRLSSTTFLRQVLIALYGENINSNKLFEYFKKRKINGDEILDFSNQMKKISKVYSDIEVGKYSDYYDDEKMYILYKLLGIKQFYPLLIRFYDETQAKKDLLIDAVVRLGAAIVFSYNQTNLIEKMLPNIIVEYNNNSGKDSEGAFTKLLEGIDSEIENYAKLTKTVLAERNHAGRNGQANAKAATILKFIEYYFNKNDFVRNVPRGKKITVEHILSRNLKLEDYKITNEKLGFESDKERESYLHKIGNLTLLYNTDNSAIGNGIFQEKKEVYKQSTFIITSSIIKPLTTPIKNGKDTAFYQMVNENETQYASGKKLWTKEYIDERGNDIANFMYSILTKTTV